jgi:PiT family inorganic phosphate transporter
MHAVKFLIIATGNSSRSKLNRAFRWLQILSAALLSFSHGGNDAQKAMGIIVFGLVATGAQATLDVPLWVKVAAALSMGLGTSIGGWRIIKTVSRNLVRIEPVNGFTADLTSSLVIQTSTHLGMPLSTTHVISSAVLGTGSALRFYDVKWGTVTRMVMTWVITIPISFVFAYLVYWLLFKLLPL